MILAEGRRPTADDSQPPTTNDQRLLYNVACAEGTLAYIQFLGAAGTVTGSKHLINLPGDAG
ncbi:MAG TPA: hypothetical protein VEG08_07155, partial [Terriglobales bacterium]|nr:hypothetical protein [Terriglobales bacterium]